MADISKPRDLDAMLSARRARPAAIRDFTDGPPQQKRAGRVFMTPSGWLFAVGGQIALVVAIVVGVLTIPPLLSCRDRDQRGFFAGDTFAGCAAKGISARMTQFDQQVRQLILGSGR